MTFKESLGGEIGKQVPVRAIYDDIAHPALSEVGKALQGVTKIALSPISVMVWGFDKISSYLDVAIPEYFARKKVSPEKIKSPDPSIAVPTIMALTYNSHKAELRVMFTNLLGASMNSDVVDEHPAFVEIIKQLCSDEAKMLKEILKEDVLPIIKYRLEEDNQGEYDVLPYFSDICYRIGCEYPQKFPEYLDNLHRHGLVEVEVGRYLTNDEYYEKLRIHPACRKPQLQQGQSAKEVKSIYRISEFGKKFCSVCMD
ncbi:DUF4393 domain-containing protein [uncultured Fibrobacter sp.]|uniref:DUF4393 domain-containing protein n=1 Tax=uncultured Fibrobacter sp. TaxID=261512 RepID=UPI0025CFC995|nr:DUF4393 domain-containing protein [uncultured Fibrobacter sp.]